MYAVCICLYKNTYILLSLFLLWTSLFKIRDGCVGIPAYDDFIKLAYFLVVHLVKLCHVELFYFGCG